MSVPKLAETAVQRFTELDPFPQPPLIKTRYPVVLMHGFGMLASLRRQGHLHSEAMHLRLSGVTAYAPNVAPYNTVPIRSAMWEKRLEHILEETGADKLNLVAHSVGGLDARYMISQEGFHEVVASLTTISTPHRGSAIAEIMLDQPEQLRAVAADLVDWFGATTLEDATSNVLRALTELTPEYMVESFNPAYSDHPSVRYWSYGGGAGKGTDVPMNPLLRPLNAALYRREGINDGYVSIRSARWGEFMEVLKADHAHQVGIHYAPNSAFDADEFYLSLARRLSEEGL